MVTDKTNQNIKLEDGRTRSTSGPIIYLAMVDLSKRKTSGMSGDPGGTRHLAGTRVSRITIAFSGCLRSGYG